MKDSQHEFWNELLLVQTYIVLSATVIFRILRTRGCLNYTCRLTVSHHMIVVSGWSDKIVYAVLSFRDADAVSNWRFTGVKHLLTSDYLTRDVIALVAGLSVSLLSELGKVHSWDDNQLHSCRLSTLRATITPLSLTADKSISSSSLREHP